jgi:hypothetical protein
VTVLGVRVAQAQAAWDVGDTGRTGQLTLWGGALFGARLGLPLAGGDLNGDGNADVIVTPMFADSGPNREREAAGEAVIILSSGAIAGEIDLATLPRQGLPANATVIFGADAFDYLGTEVWIADVDGDRYADALIGAQQADGPDNGRPGAGELVIVWGHAAIGGNVLDLRVDVGTAVTTVYGADRGDRLGVWVGAGDADGDGIDDVLIGADQGDGPDALRTHAGETYIVYGGPALRQRRTIDVGARDVPLTVIYGIDEEDHSGCTVRGVDLDRDGAAEVLIGAGINRLSAAADAQGGLGAHATAGGDGSANDLDNVGEAYVVFGVRGERPQAIDLRSPPPSAAIIWGVSSGDVWGEELFGGDFNGDGYGDVLIGALTSDGLEGFNSGALALILGSPALPGARIELAGPPAGTTIFYGRRNSIAGDTAMLIDINRDGKDDLIIGSPQGAPMSRVNAGIVDIFFGTSTALPAIIELRDPPAAFLPYQVFGAEAGDMLAYSMAYGDVDGDGVIDPIINAMGADGNDNVLDRAGDAFVLSGVRVSEAAGQPLGTLTPTATATRTPSATPVGGCAGDCNTDGVVRVDELVRGVAIALERQPVAACAAADRDGDGRVVVNELVLAVNALLRSCAAAADEIR